MSPRAVYRFVEYSNTHAPENGLIAEITCATYGC